ncbi:MAG: hypothetical protein WD602_01680 [Actinomycetota bacterium]
MIPLRARMLGWSADLEDDLAGSDPKVFVPSIMGAGVLISLGVLFADLQRLVGVGAARRRNLARRRATVMVAPIAEALNIPAPSLPPVLRKLREREFYVWLFVLSTGFALYVAIGSTANYLGDRSPFSGVLWMEVLALSVSAVALVVGFLGFGVARRYPRIPKWARRSVERTPLGSL